MAQNIDLSGVAAQIAARLNRAGDERRPSAFFQVIEETFKVVSSRILGSGEVKIEFQFEGLVRNGEEPVTYLASGSAVIGPDGEIRPGTLKF